jgi:GNAT superfamily N-acetyltransferase
MIISVVEDDPARLAEYARVSIGFSVNEIFDDVGVTALLHSNFAIATPLTAPYWKDYDAYPGNRPTEWARRFDVSRWTILAALVDGFRVGGAVIIYDEPRIDLFRDCVACALLWDLRVAPPMRGRGVGSALLNRATELAVRRGALALRVETQQINVPACRFYARHGFYLERTTPRAYPDLPGETQLLWRKSLDARSAAPSG